MTVIKRIRQNPFLTLVALAYLILFLARPAMGVEAIKSSGYYIKEMLMIMPAIFILTALLDIWVPKEKITRYLGKDSRGKGAVLSFVVGSVSAGPVYAAFPMCVMLHKKGASIRNIVIILSSWAAIKIPMLLNEARFLGPRFMAIRWVLTVTAILFFSWVTAKLVRDADLPGEAPAQAGLRLDREACIGCALCAKSYPELFEMKHKKAHAKSHRPLDRNRLADAINACPVNAISYQEDAAV